MSRAPASPPNASERDADAALIARFRVDLAALTTAAPIGLAVSGGPDSMALLALAAGAFPSGVTVATVDHRLRPDAAAEAAMVAAQCRALGVPHTTLVPDAPIAGASLQAQARVARYGLLARWAAERGIDAVATAHHADDQAETLLMRAARGSGVAGLAGIRARATIDGTMVVRPLLGWRRAELRAIVRRRGLPFVDDPANDDPRHDRTRVRRLLDANEWLDPPALARTAAALAEANDDLAALADVLWHERATEGETSIAFDPAGLPRDALRRLSRRAVAAVRASAGIAAPSFDEASNIEALLDALVAGRRATQAGVLGGIRRGRWYFRPAPPRRSH